MIRVISSIKNMALLLSVEDGYQGIWTGDGATTESSSVMDSTFKSIVDIILSIFRYIGIALLVWGLGMLALAFKNDDSDSKSRAIMIVIASILLIFLKNIVDLVLGSEML